MKISYDTFTEVIGQWDKYFNIGGWFRSYPVPQITGDLFDPIRIYYYNSNIPNFTTMDQPTREFNCWLWFEKGEIYAGGNIKDLVAKRGVPYLNLLS